jgi:hypothetical protein
MNSRPIKKMKEMMTTPLTDSVVIATTSPHWKVVRHLLARPPPPFRCYRCRAFLGEAACCKHSAALVRVFTPAPILPHGQAIPHRKSEIHRQELVNRWDGKRVAGPG